MESHDMTPAELASLGARAYGTNWQSPLARALGVNPRTVRKLVSGERPVSPRMERLVVALLGAPKTTHATALAEVLKLWAAEVYLGNDLGTSIEFRDAMQILLEAKPEYRTARKPRG
jgi:transcriptional regulator with XRE-family HTH domain